MKQFFEHMFSVDGQNSICLLFQLFMKNTTSTTDIRVALIEAYEYFGLECKFIWEPVCGAQSRLSSQINVLRQNTFAKITIHSISLIVIGFISKVIKFVDVSMKCKRLFIPLKLKTHRKQKHGTWYYFSVWMQIKCPAFIRCARDTRNSKI